MLKYGFPYLNICILGDIKQIFWLLIEPRLVLQLDLMYIQKVSSVI